MTCETVTDPTMARMYFCSAIGKLDASFKMSGEVIEERPDLSLAEISALLVEMEKAGIAFEKTVTAPPGSNDKTRAYAQGLNRIHEKLIFSYNRDCGCKLFQTESFYLLLEMETNGIELAILSTTEGGGIAEIPLPKLP